ncbi:hypothetical protein HDU87_007003 [Geranomyces variabilis]|uniref:ADP-ribosylhydrolase ARH3 n=1 Tax=Geranomyces variabilis TaxID=109894 RepID=A0AAD5TH82_9FUNG|nr:hypothetical protein HDU87_007003 [Geranomyces variabilis]
MPNYDAIADKIRGCIFGSALGDAVGLATEFMSKDTAYAIYGDAPLSFDQFYIDSHRQKWIPGDFTDDTDQHMILLSTILAARPTLRLSSTEFARRLYAWSCTGLLTLRKPSLGIGATVGTVLSQPDYTSHPIATAFEMWVRGGKSAAANGAVMRVAALGCVGFWCKEEEEVVVVRNAVASARCTHADPRCVFSAVVVAVLVARMLREEAGGGGVGVNGGGGGEVSPAELTVEAFGGDDDEPGDFELPEDIRRPGNAPAADAAGSGGIFTRLANVFSSLTQKTRAQQWASIYEEFAQRLKTTRTNFPAPPSKPAPPPAPPSTTTAFPTTPDPARLAATQAVLATYLPLLAMYGAGTSDQEWEFDVATYCHKPTLATLALDDRATMGYTLKCLGVALLCHAIPATAGTTAAAPPPPHGALFRDAITAVVREGGDADTNAAVCGALVGCRVGYKELPKEWLAGLRNKAWLEERVDALIEVVIERLKTAVGDKVV